MPQIKNTKKLIKRAVKHAEADRFRQEFSYLARLHEDNDEVEGNIGEIKGCAIGCLAAPVKQVKLEELIEQWKSNDFYVPRRYAVEVLEDEFGICLNLADLTELIFEKINGDSIENAKKWPEEFARALNEGAIIENDHVAEFIDSFGSKYDEIYFTSDYHGDDYSPINDSDVDNVYELKADILDWLKNQEAA